MKKIIFLLIAAVMAIGFCACGSTDDSSDSTWTRTGTFTDENQNLLLIANPDDGEHDGQWAVSVILADGDVHGWFLEQKGETLSGNLNSEIDDTDSDYIVTISEEGENGLMMEVEGGETYHFTMKETPDYIALLKINTDGMGTIAYGPEGSEVEFDEEFPTQSATENIEEPTNYVIKAKPDEGWRFVKWTKDGEDYSTEAEITVEVSEDAEYRAVFDTE